MDDAAAPPAATPYEPKRPTLAATAAFAVWAVVLGLPMLAGRWLASPWSDQYRAGYPFHAWSAEWIKRTGKLPLWNPEIFGGMPFVAAGSGDLFYPTWLLRLGVPAWAAGNVGFFVHYILAGLFAYLLFRRLGVGWTGSVVGGLAYELSGLIASYPMPGHDGKLFASAALPLLLLGLVLALRDRRWHGYTLVAAATALSLLSHFQLAYYSLIVGGLFALYLTFEADPARREGERLTRLGVALGAVVLGFGIAAIQIVPFFQYIPYSPRASGFHGFAGSTSYAIPWVHVPEFFVKNFVGATPQGTYWGPNPLKFHSEYLGLPVIALAVLGLTVPERRRQVVWVGAIGLLFLLISLGAGTPFYSLWWAVMPLVQKTRAPGMAFYVVAFVTAFFAALGVERARGEGARRLVVPASVVGGLLVLFGVTGAVGEVATGLAGASGHAAAEAAAPAIAWGAVSSGLALVVAGAVLGLAPARLAPRTHAIILCVVVSGDLWLNARQFWVYTKPYGRDAVIDRLAAAPGPYRALNLGALVHSEIYPGSTLMTFDIPQVLGYHGNELRYYDDLLGGRNLGLLTLWDLLAVRYAIVPVGAPGLDSIPGFRRILDSVPTGEGALARLLERSPPPPYARVVPGAVQADSATIIPTLVDPRMDPSRIVLFTTDQAVTPEPLKELPQPSASRGSMTAWQPGHMTIALEPPPSRASYLLVAENWYPDWRALVDGQQASVLRGDYSLITVPLPAGAKTVELTFRSASYELGRAISLASLAAFLVGLLVGVMQGRPRDG